MNKLKTMIVAVAALFGAMSASALELVTNGGFENGTVEGYSFGNPDRKNCTPVGGWSWGRI